MMSCFLRRKEKGAGEKRMRKSYDMEKGLIAGTGNAKIYSCGETDGMVFVEKMYTDARHSREFMEREKKISQEIYSRTQKREVVIPILAITEDGAGRMMLKKHGQFLNDLILSLDTEYESSDIRGILLKLGIIREILLSLDTIHFCGGDGPDGYVHLDLHPGNIFFENTDIDQGQIGTAKFIDFLSAKPVVDGKVLQGESEFVIASPGYAAQEYLEGSIDAICRATDLYSVGKIFCRMLVQRPVPVWEEDFLQYSKDALEKALGSSLIAGIVSPFISCALDSNPKYRYQTAAGMKAAVEDISTVLGNCLNRDYDKVLSYLYEKHFAGQESLVEELKFDEERLLDSVKRLKKALLEDHINSSKCYFVYKGLRGLLEKNKKEIIDYKTIKNILLVSGISCCNHMGRSSEAIELYEEFQPDETGLSLDDYLVLINRTAVSYADSLDYGGAYRLIGENIASLEAIKKTRKRIVSGLNMNIEASRVKDLARAYSAKGCYMVLCGKKEDNGKTPLYYFDRALEEFGNDRGNRKITVSHVLQYAVEINNKDIFEKYAVEENYFGAVSRLGDEGTLVYILEDILSQEDPYSLHVFLKGIYSFYLDNISDEFLDILNRFLYNDFLYFDKNNPMELVLRRVGQILSEKNGHKPDSNVLRAYNLAMDYVPEAKINPDCPINILTLIAYQTKYQYNQITGCDNRELYRRFMDHCSRFGNKRIVELYKDGPEKLNNVLCFEYI